MHKRISDLPPILPPGMHPITWEWLQIRCVDEFPLSRKRVHVLEGLRRICRELDRLLIPAVLIVDGSFLTEEIEPSDIDFAVCVEYEFYEFSATEEQAKYLDWIRDEKSIKETHLCDCNLIVEFPPDHPTWFEGIQDRAWWFNFYATSKIHQRVRGVGVLDLTASK